VESESEYIVSKQLFYVWLNEQKENKILSELSVMAITAWVTNNLEPYESMWLNYTRLFAGGMDQRTSSPAEAMYWSMKSGYNAVHAAMNSDFAAEVMMDNSNKKAKDLENYNADQISRTKLWTNDPTLQNLTDWCAKNPQEEWNLSSQYKIIQNSDDELLVFKPIIRTDLNTGRCVTKFYRVRVIKLVNNKCRRTARVTME
jgi:hypothetical protein